MAHFKNLTIDGDLIIKGTLETDEWLPGAITVDSGVVPKTIDIDEIITSQSANDHFEVLRRANS